MYMNPYLIINADALMAISCTWISHAKNAVGFAPLVPIQAIFVLHAIQVMNMLT
jgi:hypothetical protein